MDKLYALYWSPLYAFLLRLGKTPPGAQDYAQGLFDRLVEQVFLQHVTPSMVTSERYSAHRFNFNRAVPRRLDSLPASCSSGGR